ncbi:hypothetical protein DFH06DRAFT_1090237 [Mycena polygramma]|nr:hypothetical protein DFH06DRAFT_1090237 [Mycena polygramma]
MTQSPPAVHPPLVPQPPFSEEGADTILRTSDGVDFHVYRRVLSLASPFFRDMFSVPQPETEPNVPVIPVAESSHLLDRALRVFYPGAEMVEADGLDQLAQILEVVSKYDIQFVAPSLRYHLEKYLDTEPLIVYTVACRYGWAHLAKVAAKHSLKLSLPVLINSNPTQHLRHIPAHFYQALLLYHGKCSTAASSAGRLLPWSKATWSWIACGNQVQLCPAYSRQYNVPGVSARRTPKAWIFDYLDRAQALLKETPGAISSLSTPEFLAPTHAKVAVCIACQFPGFSDLATFIRDDYIPKVNEAIEGVSLDVDFGS